MKELSELLNKIILEKEKEKEEILKEAQIKKEEILASIRKEAQNYFSEIFLKKKEELKKKKREILFEEKLKNKRLLLQEKEELIKDVFKEIKSFLEKNPNFIPKKEIVKKDEKIQQSLTIEEFLEFLKENFKGTLLKIIDDELRL